MDDYVPKLLQQILQRELAPSERVIWLARPAPFSRIFSSSGTFLFGIPFFAFAIYWTWAATGGLAKQRGTHDPGAGWFGFLWGGMFVLVGTSMLFSPLWSWWLALRTLYVITDRRALLIEAPFRRTIQSFADERLINVVRRESWKGRGDIIFERQAFRGGKGGTYYRDVGFFGLADAKNVEELLRTTHLNLKRS